MRTYRIYNLAHRLCGLAHLAQRGMRHEWMRDRDEGFARWESFRMSAIRHLRAVAQRFV